MRSLIRDHIHIITSINNGGAENNITDLLCEMGIDKSHNNPLNITVLYLKGNGYWKKKLENKERILGFIQKGFIRIQNFMRYYFMFAVGSIFLLKSLF